MIKTDYKQSHFVLYELVLPYCATCTPVSGLTEKWHTPITCEQESDSTYRLWFASSTAPMELIQPSPSINLKSRLNSSIFRCVTSSKESTPKLKAGEGLASRGTMSITCADFDGDPGPINFSEDGTFFGKLLARNVLDGKKIITHYYTVTDFGGIEEVSTSTHFVTNTKLSDGKFTLSAKDALKDVEAFSQKFPEPSKVELTAAIDATTTTIPVTDDTGFVANSVFRIDDELFIVQSTSGNNITVKARGTGVTNADGTRVFKTHTDEHDIESTVQPCYVMSKTPLATVLQDLCTAAGLSEFIDSAQWTAEIEEWNANAFLYGVVSDPTEIGDLINAKLSDYMIDMWLDQPTQKIKVSAVSAWKESVRILSEGDDLSALSITTDENARFSRAMIYNGKRYQTGSDEAQNYSRLASFTDTATEHSDRYGVVKLKDFEFSPTITSASATILCSRFVQRYARTPKQIKFTMEERKLDGLKLGDVIDVVSRNAQMPNGQFFTARDRAQVIRIQPRFKLGRQYDVEALAYVPLVASNPDEELVIRLTGAIFDENLFARAGAPNVPVNVTFIFDSMTIGSSAHNIPSVRAGAFAAGSRIKIICTNGTKWSAMGGDGGLSEGAPAGNGGDAYQSDGVSTEIYLNYGNVDGYGTDATLYAAGGGGAHGSATILASYDLYMVASTTAVGGGGSGIPGGNGVSTSFESENIESAQGTFSSGGSGANSGSSSVSLGSGRTASSSVEPSSGASGGSSVNGESTSASASTDGTVVSKSTTGTTDGGLAGGAIKGANVTVYNTNASRFRQGNSDSFTLITS